MSLLSCASLINFLLKTNLQLFEFCKKKNPNGFFARLKKWKLERNWRNDPYSRISGWLGVTWLYQVLKPPWEKCDDTVTHFAHRVKNQVIHWKKKFQEYFIFGHFTVLENLLKKSHYYHSLVIEDTVQVTDTGDSVRT